TESRSKINAVYAYGEEKRKGGGMEDMKTVVSEIVGQPIGYALAINFKGFTDLVNAIDGVEVDLKQPFEENMQFNEERACDSYVFTKPTGNFENKTTKYYSETSRTYKTRIIKSYPLCTNPNVECGGDFKLPAGKQTLNGEQALCYARSRKTSSDFERAKRQQLVIQKIKEKALSLGTLTDFNKVNGIIDSLGNNVRTDMQAWEMKRLYEIERGMENPQMAQRVLENSQEGLLYNPEQRPETGYILLPIGDNYDKIREVFKNIFTIPAQSDIEPKA
ncbi:MAG: LCP family protein, partial [Candidatus Moranbacteria bacterium]|nr:LCP family protein [Candidatus Moranbacteria bacterium]